MVKITDYSIDTSGIHQTHGDHGHTIPWEEVVGLKHSLLDGSLHIQGKKYSFPLHGESLEVQQLLEKFYRAWEKKFPEQAKKNAFDYAFPNKAFAGILLTVCLLLAMPFGVALAIYAFNQHSCTQQLSRGSEAVTAKVTSLYLSTKEFYILGLNFTAADGTVINTHDRVFVKKGTNPPEVYPLIYAKENPKCWTTPTGNNKAEVNWARHRYFSAFNMLFACFSMLGGATGIIFSILRLREKRMHTEFVSRLFALR